MTNIHLDEKSQITTIATNDRITALDVSEEVNGNDTVGYFLVSQLDDRYLLEANDLSDLNNATTARSNLGIAIGSDVQAWDAQLDDIAALTPSDGNFIVGDGSNFVVESGATARTSLGAQAQGDVLDDLNTLGAATADGEFLVATGAGALAWESGSTARDSIGLGTLDSPTFTNINATGALQLSGTDINTGGTLSNVAYLDQAQTFTAAQKIDVSSATAFVVEDDGVQDDVLVVDTLNGRVGVGITPTQTLSLPEFAIISFDDGREMIQHSSSSSGRISFRANNSQMLFIQNPVQPQVGIGGIPDSNLALHVIAPASKSARISVDASTNSGFDAQVDVKRPSTSFNSVVGIFTGDVSSWSFGMRASSTSFSLQDEGSPSDLKRLEFEEVDGFGAVRRATTATGAILDILNVVSRCDNTPADGFGGGLLFQLESSTTEDQNAGRLSWEWATATHASRKALSKWTVYDTAEREGLRIEADGSAPMIGFLGAAAVVQQNTTDTTTGFTQNAGTEVRDDSTFTGNSGSTAYTIGDIILALKNYGLLAA